MKADRDAHMQEVVAKTVSAIEERMETIVNSIRSERDEKIQCRSENIMECEEQGLKDIESGVEHREVSKEEAAVKSWRVTKKQPRG
jgi:hypothetical protein